MSPPSSSTAAAFISPPLRVFLVEDSSLVRELVIETFADIEGIMLAGWADAEDAAFEQLCAGPCQILILDIELKTGNGINLLRRLAAQPSQSDLIRIVFSNNVSPAYHRVARPLGVQFFFDKTTQFAELGALLEQLGRGADAASLTV